MNGALWLAVPTFAMMCTPAISAPQAQADYAAWVRPYQAGALKASFGEEPGGVKLVITAIEGDDRKPDDRSRDFSGLGYKIKSGCSVSTDGRLSYFSYTAMSAKGGGYPGMPEAGTVPVDCHGVVATRRELGIAVALCTEEAQGRSDIDATVISSAL